MKQTYRIFGALIAAASMLTLAACSDDDLTTNQYQGGYTLNAYGPNPIVRGAMMRFVGSNLDQTASIAIPNVDAVTTIEVKKSGEVSEIWITVPKYNSGEGKYTLTSRTGQTIETSQSIFYTEGIEFEAFSPEAAAPGEVLTISGEYLNNVAMIEFADEIWVPAADFIKQERHEIQVAVPDSAMSGKVKLYDTNLIGVEDPSQVTYSVFPSDNVLEVKTASIESIKSPRGTYAAQGTLVAKVGETVTISGSNFQYIEAVHTSGEAGEYQFTDFTVNADGTELSFNLPAEAKDGDLSLVMLSGVKAPVATLASVAPSGAVIAPAKVKNGTAFTITGQDLDVVSSVTVPHVDEAVEVSISASQITGTLPAATQAGELILHMANGTTVPVALELVEPVVSAYSVEQANAGAVISVNGTDLDLVSKVLFHDATEDAEATDITATSFNVTVPMSATSGEVQLLLANGDTLTTKSLDVVAALFCYVTDMITREEAVEPGVNVTLPVENGDKLTEVYVNDIKVNFLYNASAKTLTLPIPEGAKEYSPLRLVSSNGEYTTTLPVDIKSEYDISTACVDEGGNLINFPLTIGWSDGGRIIFNASKEPFTSVNLTAGVSKIIFYYGGGTGQAQINNSSWTALTYLTEWNDASVTQKELILTEEMVEALSNPANTQAIIIQGSDWTISKLVLIPNP